MLHMFNALQCLLARFMHNWLPAVTSRLRWSSWSSSSKSPSSSSSFAGNWLPHVMWSPGRWSSLRAASFLCRACRCRSTASSSYSSTSSKTASAMYIVHCMVTLAFRPAVSYMPALSAKLLWKEKKWRLATPADSHSAHTMAGTRLLTRYLTCPSEGSAFQNGWSFRNVSRGLRG